MIRLVMIQQLNLGMDVAWLVPHQVELLLGLFLLKEARPVTALYLELQDVKGLRRAGLELSALGMRQ